MTEQRNDIWILGAIVATESGSAQGQADVAQSIYNRVESDRFPNTIYEVVTRDNQYQPAFVDPSAKSGAGAKVAPEWKAVKDEATAVTAIRSYYEKRNQPITESQARERLNSSISAIQNPTLRAEAARHVGDRTDFRGANVLTYNPANVSTRGGSNDNRFGGGTANGTAAGVPSTLTTVVINAEPVIDTVPTLFVGGPGSSSSNPVSVSDPAEYPTREYGNTDKYSDQILKDKLKAGSDRIEELENQTFLTDEDKEEQQKILAERADIIDELAKRQSSDCVSHQTQGKSWRFKDTPKCEQFAASTTYQNAVKEFEEKLTLPNPCGSGELSRINTALHKFFIALKGMKKYGDLYINGAINKTRKLTRLLRNVGNIIGAAMKTLMQKARDWLLRKIRNGIKDLIHMLFPTIAKSIKESIIGRIIDTILCKFKEVISNLPNLILDFLFELIGKVVNIPFCAAQQWANGLINNLVSQIDTAIGPILDEINDVLSGVAKIAGSVFEAIDFILGFESFLCEKPNCPEITEFEAGPWGGPSAAQIKAFSGFAAIPSVGDANDFISDAIGNIPIFGETLGEGAGSDVPIPSSITQCDPSAYRCGPPTIQIFGGGGVNAAANAVVDGFGKLIGVDIVNRGSGYKTPPFVAIVDSCGNGNYASGYSVLNGSGEVVKIIIVNSGSGYLNAPNGLDEFGEEAFTTPTNSDNVRDYVVCLDEIQVIGTGIGYTSEDEIRMVPDIPNLSASVQMTEAGQIIGISILDKPCSLTTIPEIRINSKTGEGFSARIITSVQETGSFDSEDSFRSGTLVTVIDCIR